MARNIDQAEAWARSGPKRTINSGDWDGGCEAYVVNAGALTPYPSAMKAGDASGPLDKNPDTAQRGEFHYWAGVRDPKTGEQYGHVGIELGGNQILMASALAARNGVNLGWSGAIITFHRYQALTGLPYRGHSFRHGALTLDRSSSSGGGTTPNPPIARSKDMAAIVTAGFQPGTPTYKFSDGMVKAFATAHEGLRYLLANDTDDSIRYVAPDKLTFNSIIQVYGLGEYTVEQITYLGDVIGVTADSPNGKGNLHRGGFLIASWLRGGTVDPVPIVAAAKAGAAEAVKDLNVPTVTEIAAAVDGVIEDEAILAVVKGLNVGDVSGLAAQIRTLPEATIAALKAAL